MNQTKRIIKEGEKIMTLTIDPEFESLIPPLSQDEYKQLEQNILKSGRPRDAIIAWDSDYKKIIIIDGHNRYKICTEHKLPYNVYCLYSYNLASREEVKLWIINNQLGRRNLSDATRIKLATQKNEYLKTEAKENQSAAGGDKVSEGAFLTKLSKAVEEENLLTTLSKSKNEPVNVRKAIAKDAGVSEGTVQKYNKIIKEGTPELIEQVEKGEKKINTAFKELPEKKRTVKKNPTPELPIIEKPPQPFSDLTMYMLYVSDLNNNSLIKGEGNMLSIKTSMLESDFLEKCEPEALLIFKERTEAEIQILTNILNKINFYIKEPDPPSEPTN
jgi:hypothetical protein